MTPQVEGSELAVMSAFPWEAYTVDVLTVERPSIELHALLVRRNYCLRALLGNEVGDAMYVRRDAWGGALVASRTFGEGPRAPCASPRPLHRNISRFVRSDEWCAKPRRDLQQRAYRQGTERL